jgi:integrase
MMSERDLREILLRNKPYKLADAGGLFLLVRPTGHHGWRFKYRIHGREKLLSFGPYPEISLAKARAQRKAAKALLRDGVDPSVTRQAEKTAGTNSFEAIAREWIALYSPRWTVGYLDHVLRRLERDIFPWIGATPIKALRPADILSCLQRIEARGNHETAHRAYQNIGWIFRHAIATHHCTNDVSAALKGALLPTHEEHLAAITDPQEFGALLRAIDAYAGSHTVRTALRLAPLVFVRPSELRAAEWSEFHLANQEWRIPPERMKMRVPHIVPLATQAIALLKEIQPVTGDGKYVFPSPRTRQRPLSNVALLAALRRMGYEQGTVTVHGFRASASTLLNEQGWRADAIERQLAHGERDNVRAAYNHAEYLPERKLMMQGWANYLDELKATHTGMTQHH